MYQHFIPFYGQIIFHRMDIPHFVYLFFCWWTSGLFPLFSVIMNNTVRTFMCIFLCGCMSSFLTGMRNCQTFLQSGCNMLHSHQQCMRVLIALHPCQYSLFFIFLIIGILVSVKLYLIVVLICIPLMDNDVELLFMFLFGINISSLVKCLFKFYQFSLGCLSC